MPIICLSAPIRWHAECPSSMKVPAGTVADALDGLVAQSGSLGRVLFTGERKLQPFLNVYVNGADIRTLQGLDTPLADSDTVLVIGSVAGG